MTMKVLLGKLKIYQVGEQSEREKENPENVIGGKKEVFQGGRG